MLAILIKRVEILTSGDIDMSTGQHSYGIMIFEKRYNRGPIIICEFVSLITRQGAVPILKEINHLNGTFVILFAMLHGKNVWMVSDAAGFVVGADGADDVGGLFAAAEVVKDGGYIIGNT